MPAEAHSSLAQPSLPLFSVPYAGGILEESRSLFLSRELRELLSARIVRGDEELLPVQDWRIVMVGKVAVEDVERAELDLE